MSRNDGEKENKKMKCPYCAFGKAKKHNERMGGCPKCKRAIPAQDFKR